MKKLLVVVDMQNDFVTGCLGTKEAQEIVPNVVDLIKNFEGDIWFTRDTHYDDYLETQEGKKLPVVHCIKDTEGWNIIPELEPFLNNTRVYIYNKTTFGSVKLAKDIYKIQNDVYTKHYDEIYLCGVCTGICVISNAMLLKANTPETPIKIVANACACVTPESHNIALEAMKTCQIEVI